MSLKVKIIGAGSIGNHLAFASRQMGWSVDIYDIDHDALLRTKDQIYPDRYGKWDETINLYKIDKNPNISYDLVIIGTPPETHVTLAQEAINQGAKAVLIEKPAATPNLKGVQELFQLYKNTSCKVFVGYNHTVGRSVKKMTELLSQNVIGKIQTLDVEFREHWGGIFLAHPWLKGPSDSYLGFWEKGGGSCGEHSHAINLWQHYAKIAGMGRVVDVNANLEYINDGKLNYDSLSLINLKTENGFLGRVVQDVVTRPNRKWARAQGENGFLEWYCDQKKGVDTVLFDDNRNKVTEFEVKKNRPDDFYQKMKHINDILNGKIIHSPITLESGLDTMLVISAAHISAKYKKSVEIDYSKGYVLDAISVKN